MGYRSDIRIVTSKNGFEKLTEFVKNYIKENELDIEYDNLLDSLDIKLEGKQQCYFGWDSYKWCEGYPEVDAILEGIEKLEEEGYSYRYMIIGENYDDVEQHYFDGKKDKDICLEYPSMIREFDDDYVKSLIEDKTLNNLEENKDEIDI